MKYRYVWSFSIEWTERHADPATENGWRTVTRGEALTYPTELKAMERRQWHIDNMGSWTPEIAVDAFVSDVARRLIGTEEEAA